MAKASSDAAKQSSLTSLGNMDEVEKVFKKFDTNNDGKISASELRAVFRALGSSDTLPEKIETAVAEIDKNGDGLIDLKEFADFNRKAGSDAGDGSRSDSKEVLGDAFELYDRDKDGVISAGELHAVLKGLGEKCSVEDCARMVGAVDVDGDGCVNFEEFKKMMRP